MKSLVGELVAVGSRVRNAADPAGRPPVAYENTPAVPFFTGHNYETLLRAYTADPALFAITDRIVTDISQHDWDLYTRPTSGRSEDRTVIASHAMIDLWDEPNPHMDRIEFLENAMLHYELAAESYWVIGVDDRMPDLPLSLWPVPPHMMDPVPSADRFLGGYVFRGPDGRRVPFPTSQVIHIKKANPLDPYRGTSATEAMLVDLDASVAAARWNRNFFANSAEPGGIIEVTENLPDAHFDELNARWNEQHRGTANAHRVAILEAGMQWKDRSFSMRDMQFTELRRASNENIMLAKGMSKTLLGQTEGVNRATAEAAEYVYGKYQTRTRLRKVRSVLNRRLLRRYANGDRYAWDFDDPVTGNVDEEATDRDSRIGAAMAYIQRGADPAQTLEAFDLPSVEFAEPEPVPAALQPYTGGEPPEIGPGAEPEEVSNRSWRFRALNQAEPDLDPSELPSLERMRLKFESVIEGLLADWTGVEETQKAALVAQVMQIASTGTIADLEMLTTNNDQAVTLLIDAMEDIARDAAEDVVDEAAEQGVRLQPAVPARIQLRDVAVVAAGLIAARLIGSAKSNAMRANSTAASPSEVADAVRAALGELSVEGPKPQLTAALVGSRNEARLQTIERGPVGACYSNETLDEATCGPCRKINGKWLGNSDEMGRVRQSYPGGLFGGYKSCEGRERCRGVVNVVYRPTIDRDPT